MEGLTIDAFLSTMIPLTLYFIITLIGSLAKDRYNTITKKDEPFRLSRMIIGGLCGAFIMLWLEPILLMKLSISQVICVAFVVGTVSFEMFGHISKLDNIRKFIKKLIKAKDIISAIDLEDEKPPENKNKNG